MLKKLLIFSVLLIMALSVFACSGGGEEIDEELAALNAYKATAKADLEDYADEKGQENYTDENWAKIAQFVIDGVAAIDLAENTNVIDEVIAQAKENIDWVNDELNLDLKTIIQQDVFNSAFKKSKESADKEDFRYLGSYNNCIVIYQYQLPGGLGLLGSSQVIADVYFSGGYKGSRILVWKDGDLMELSDAYDQGFIQRNDLVRIVWRYTGGGYRLESSYYFSKNKDIFEFLCTYSDNHKRNYEIDEELNLDGIRLQYIMKNGLLVDFDPEDYYFDTSAYNKDIPGRYDIKIILPKIVYDIYQESYVDTYVRFSVTVGLTESEE